jgi:hypothetical protein
MTWEGLKGKKSNFVFLGQKTCVGGRKGRARMSAEEKAAKEAEKLAEKERKKEARLVERQATPISRNQNIPHPKMYFQ